MPKNLMFVGYSGPKVIPLENITLEISNGIVFYDIYKSHCVSQIVDLGIHVGLS